MGCGASVPAAPAGAPSEKPSTGAPGTSSVAVPAARPEADAGPESSAEAAPGSSRLTIGVTLAFLRDLPSVIANLEGPFPEVSESPL